MMVDKRVIGIVYEHNKNLEPFASYTVRLEFFLNANYMNGNAKIPLFMSIMGPELHSVLKNLLLPNKTSDKS